MTLELAVHENGNIIEVKASGRLTKEDYERFIPEVERLALVGEAQWEKGMAIFCKPFTTAQIRYFDQEQAEEARKWIEAP